MNSLRPSPAMATYITDRIDNIETYQAIQEKREAGFRLKGALTLPDGEISLLFLYDKNSDCSRPYFIFANVQARNFSSNQEESK